jgi:undecaprenyl diphosphate synthase
MNKLNHVAIIMDGNGRWGLKKNKSRNYGHLKGLKSVEKVIATAIRNKIPYLTLYTFSTENWKRPKNEINFLFDLIRKSLKSNLRKIIKQEIKINIIGKKKDLPPDIIKIIKYSEKKTKKNKKLTLNIALNYGSKEEIVSACKKFLKKPESEISIETLEKNLYTNNIPDPDILIRTGGTQRLSNFLLWQAAYSEIYFVKKMWPEFNEYDFKKIIKKFFTIKRNFGNVN